MIGYSDATLISRFERGRSIPPLETAMKLSVLFQVPLARLFPEVAERTKVEVLASEAHFRPTRRKVFLSSQEDI